MAYNFFEKWKQAQSEVFSIKKEIEDIERLYKIKIMLFKKIFDKFEDKKIDSSNAKRLLRLYKHARYSTLYDIIIAELRKLGSLDLFTNKEIDQFYELVSMLADSIKKQNQIALSILDNLISGRLPEPRKIYELRDLIKQESAYLDVEGERFKRIEATFVMHKDPGAGTGGYMKLIESVQRGIVSVDGNKLSVDSKPIEGMEIDGNMVIFKGDHYTNMQSARWIQGDEHLNASDRDPYSYLVERGKLHNYTRQQIQKILGVPNAEAVVALVVSVFPEQVYLKIQSGKPIKMAILNLDPRQVSILEKADLVA